MAVLHINPESSALVHAAAATIPYLHISAGGVGLLSGASPARLASSTLACY